MAGVTDRWQENVSGSTLCTMKVGGPVQWLSRPTTREELETDLEMAKEQGIPVRILGGGSDVLLPDDGFRGLIIIPANKTLEVMGEVSFDETPLPFFNERYRIERGKGFLELVEPTIEQGDYVWVRIGAGVPWGQVVMWTFTQGLLGLQGFARIPCTVGGGIYNNIHGEKRFLSEFVQTVTSFSNRWRTRLPSELAFGYDHSVFHEVRNEVIWEVVLRLSKGSVEAVTQAKEQYLAWTKAKTEKQPSGANCGSVFQNLSPDESAVARTGMVAAGWYVDHAGCLGWSEGDMHVYPTHGNFFINQGNGTQRDFIRLVSRVREEVHIKYEYWLKPEVICIDSDGNDIAWQTS